MYQEKLDSDIQKTFAAMQWNGVISPEIESFLWDESGFNPESLIKDFVDNFRSNIEGKTAWAYDIKPTITGDKIYNLTAEYKVW